MEKLLKSQLSKVNFALGRTPQIEHTEDIRRFVPAPYRSVFTLSADFELAWAWRFAKSFDDPVQGALQKARLARKNMPVVLDLCEQYQVPITWATVGHLFLEACQHENGVPHPDVQREPHFENGYWKFTQGDWFKDDPGTDVHTDPEWYCPDLLDVIQASAVPHEIACHTFSHIDCRDGVCPPEVFRSELKKCQELAAQRNVTLKTLIYPAHTVGNLDELAKLGFTNYRTNHGHILGYPVHHANGLWEIKSSLHMEIRPEWSAAYHLHRAKKTIDRALMHQSVGHFWFHPSFHPTYLQEVFPGILSYLAQHRDQILITTTDRYVDWLNGGSGEWE